MSTAMQDTGRAAQGACNHTWVSVEDLAAELRIPKSTIYGWKSRGTGPEWIRVGKHLRARRATIDTWLNSLNEAA
ncbi:helix-turn-helix transcriptional regulator [Streptomyces microflavus]|uniref:helix-turn-helix transcriptional regulator n=1 Tax=Streptomyces microflavus TaxID=1919 RepID=UPI00365B3210